MCRTLILTVTVFLMVTSIYAQTSLDPDSSTFPRDVDKSEDFTQLADTREDLTQKIGDLERTIQTETGNIAKLPDLAEQQSALKEKQLALTRAQGERPINQELISELNNTIEMLRQDIDDNSKARNQINQSLREARTRLAQLRQKRLRVEERITALLRATKETATFRWITSLSFCVLVSIVILGFYKIAWEKDGIALTIFSGEKGMQFITLFLIVIAIILFGIMGTLEGKELSALLGGLSGYILGRTATGSSSGAGDGQQPGAGGSQQPGAGGGQQPGSGGS